MGSWRSHQWRPVWLVAAATAIVTAACGGSDHPSGSTSGSDRDGRPNIVVTYAILGDIVQRIAGDTVDVDVVIPNGQDPHEFSASAHDIEQMLDAAMIVANGLDLEEGLVDAIDRAEDEGVPVFRASDHITVRHLGADEESEHEAEHGDAHDHGGDDPHLWTDPLTVAELAPALGDALGDAVGADLSAGADAFVEQMHALDRQVRGIMSAIPEGGCTLVTGHESLGYFADRYGCTIVGAVVPSLSSTAEASAKDLAELIDAIERTGVRAIFTEVGTPSQVAEQVAGDVGVPLVELPSHALPDAGGYPAYIVDLATKIADALAGP
ncbi:MAG: metal ABC transporter substrate-binding protein [Ilumatobacteraceae bacterium]